MTITLNVLITLTGGEKVFSVWSEPVPAITGLDLAVAAGFTITDAVKTLFQALLGPFSYYSDTVFRPRNFVGQNIVFFNGGTE